VKADDPEQQDQVLLQAIRSAFQAQADATPAYILVDDHQQAEIHLYLLRPNCDNTQCERKTLAAALSPADAARPPEVWVLSAEHRPLYDNLRIRFDERDVAKGLQRLQDNLNKLARIRELKALSSPRESLATGAITVEMLQLRPDPACQKGAACLLPWQSLGWHRHIATFDFQGIGNQVFTHNDWLTFRLHNTSQDDYYCYLLELSPNGAISSIFPQATANMQTALIKAGKIRDLSDYSGTRLDVLGEETLKLIVSREPIDVALLEVTEFQQKRGPDECRGHNPLEQLLLNAVCGFRNDAQVRIDEWTTEQVGFEVREHE